MCCSLFLGNHRFALLPCFQPLRQLLVLLRLIEVDVGVHPHLLEALDALLAQEHDDGLAVGLLYVLHQLLVHLVEDDLGVDVLGRAAGLLAGQLVDLFEELLVVWVIDRFLFLFYFLDCFFELFDGGLEANGRRLGRGAAALLRF